MDSAKEISKKISVYLDRIEELEDDTAEAVLLIDEGEDEYSGELIFPVNLLPEDVSDGDYLTIKIRRAGNSTPENLRGSVDKIDAGNSTPENLSGSADKIDAGNSTPENLSARLEEIDADTSDAILIINDDKIFFPLNLLPEEISAGDTLTLEISRDADKTNAALDEARQLLEELE